jgi:ABC-type lipoprotein export system ATPase subunit
MVMIRWSRDEIQPFLKNLDVDLSRNELVMVVGPVGCGKAREKGL